MPRPISLKRLANGKNVSLFNVTYESEFIRGYSCNVNAKKHDFHINEDNTVQEQDIGRVMQQKQKLHSHGTHELEVQVIMLTHDKF